MKKVGFAVVLLLVVSATVLWQSGVYGMWKDGMAHIANNTKDFTDKGGHLIAGQYSLEVDLSDLDSNIGKEIYNDGEHRIYVSWLQQAHNGSYDVGFRSSGQYGRSGATLISGLRHETISDHSFRSSTPAQMSAEYEGKIYDAPQPTGQCGLNYKDGDCFSFSFFIPEYGEGTVKLTITDLYKNSWRKK